jgi:hypothetical protein
MSKKANPLEKIGNRSPFKTPEGYFEHLSERVMSQLPQRIEALPQPVGTWQRVQPWLYMAAMFCGIALMVNLFTRTAQPSDASGLHLSSSADIEDFYLYYEEQLTENIYNEVIFVDTENINF